jgi:hypothetical protein
MKKLLADVMMMVVTMVAVMTLVVRMFIQSGVL